MNMKKQLASYMSAASLLMLCSAAHADLGLSLRAGTLGAGVELDYAMSEKWSLRLMANEYSTDDDFEEDGIDYNAELDLSSYGAALDWHPFGGTFRLSLGAISNGNELAAASVPSDTFDIGDVTYISDDNDPASLSGTIELGDGGVAPYVGFGWGNSPSNDGGFLFSLDLGVIQSGEAQVDLVGSGTAYDADQDPGLTTPISLASNAEAQEEIAKEEQSLLDEFEGNDLYPVVMIGIGYRF